MIKTPTSGMAASRCLRLHHLGQQGEVIVVCGPSGSAKSTLTGASMAWNPSRPVKSSSTAPRSATRNQPPAARPRRHGLPRTSNCSRT